MNFVKGYVMHPINGGYYTQRWLKKDESTTKTEVLQVYHYRKPLPPKQKKQALILSFL